MICDTSFLIKSFCVSIIFAHSVADFLREITSTFSFTIIDSFGTPSEIKHFMPLA